MRAFLPLWFGAGVIMALAGPFVGVVIALDEGAPAWVGALVGVAFSLLCLAQAAAGYWLVKLFHTAGSDARHSISHHIEQALIAAAA